MADGEGVNVDASPSAHGRPLETWAVGLELALTATGDGGRRTPLDGGNTEADRFRYRPNWGLPGTVHPDQAGAPVFGFSRVDVRPGENVRAVIVPLFPDATPGWSRLRAGDTLALYEGAGVRGRATVLWIEPTTAPMPDVDWDRFAAWLDEPVPGDRDDAVTAVADPIPGLDPVDARTAIERVLWGHGIVGEPCARVAWLSLKQSRRLVS